MNASFEIGGWSADRSIEMQTANSKLFVDLDADPDAPLLRSASHTPAEREQG